MSKRTASIATTAILQQLPDRAAAVDYVRKPGLSIRMPVPGQHHESSAAPAAGLLHLALRNERFVV